MPEAAWRLEAQAASIIGHLASHLDNLSSSDKWQATGNSTNQPEPCPHVPFIASSLPSGRRDMCTIWQFDAQQDRLAYSDDDGTAARIWVRVEVPRQWVCPRRVGLVQTLRNLRQLKQTLEIDAPGMLDVARVAAATLMTFCLPASANEDVAWGHATSSGQSTLGIGQGVTARTT